jgi:hypothetical protein
MLLALHAARSNEDKLRLLPAALRNAQQRATRRLQQVCDEFDQLPTQALSLEETRQELLNTAGNLMYNSESDFHIVLDCR